MRDYIANPHFVMTLGELAETEALIRRDMEAVFARMEEEDANLEAVLAQQKLDQQP